MMGYSDESWRPFIWHCPSCSAQVTGYKDTNGTIKAECQICHAVIVRKNMGRRHDRLDIYAPKNEPNDYEP